MSVVKQDEGWTTHGKPCPGGGSWHMQSRTVLLPMTTSFADVTRMGA